MRQTTIDQEIFTLAFERELPVSRAEVFDAWTKPAAVHRHLRRDRAPVASRVRASGCRSVGRGFWPRTWRWETCSCDSSKRAAARCRRG